jgi:acyl-coenzyme A synthetase/AMP-(fatty) acid ligase
MKMLQSNPASLWNALKESDNLSGRFLLDANSRIAMSDLVEGSVLYGRGKELQGRSVLLTTNDQFTTASALIELDGVARRIVLCPPDFPLEHFPYVIDTAEVDAIVSNHAAMRLGKPRPMYFSPVSRSIVPGNSDRSEHYPTEWILLTSGTTGLPKLVVHSLESLTGAIQAGKTPRENIVWSTFYDIRRYGGLQILFRAILTGTSLVLASAHESTADFLTRAAAHGITHISGTPSHWRRALMSPSARLIKPEYVRLSGEIADQSILNHLRSVYPQARIAHAFASTEAGVAFEVNDAIAGFEASALKNTSGVEMKVEDRTLRIRSARTASRYLGENAPILKGEDGFVDTGDIVELREGRYCFAGRRDGVINIGGLKVYPEEIEAVINRHPQVQMSLVRTKKNPITGALVVADVVRKNGSNGGRELSSSAIQEDILLLCREALSPHKVPAAINFVPELTVGESGKVMRRSA